ncbi:hypothetical protein [uncultured Parabacteroides sp.]|uniref:hypothetical protein n=1 Tax=uncultured Parabacteroides sp. TaxID=512312 RepID=UPI0026296736|nr:hypothetical protein [uncultured Parabacteroides sp.]
MHIKTVRIIERLSHAIEFIKDIILFPLFKIAMKKCGNNIIFGPAPTIVTGTPRTDVISKHIIASQDKLLENDKKACLKDDIRIGANVAIHLKPAM